jgi:hypothetical protein
MNSGIEFGQSLSADWRSAFDPSAQMVFDMADEAAFAETAELGAAPETRWNYTNGTMPAAGWMGPASRNGRSRPEKGRRWHNLRGQCSDWRFTRALPRRYPVAR